MSSINGLITNQPRILLPFVGTLTLSCLSDVRADPVRNANWWGKLNNFQRQAYVTGVFDGISTELLLMAGDTVSARVAWNEKQKIQQLLGGITSDEMIKRLERFYRDRRNQSVLVGEAVGVVALQGHVTKEMGAAYQDALNDARKRGAKGW